MKLVMVNVNRKIFSDKVAPLGLCSIAAYLREYGGFNNIQIIDQNTEDIYYSIKKAKADIIGVSSVTQNFNEAERFIRFIGKQLNVPIILGGVHISTLPVNCPKDVIGVMGEGEETMLELMNLFEKDGEFKLENLKNIKGICYYHNGKLQINERRPLIQPLDKIPLPNRDLLDMKYYLKKSKIVPYQYAKILHMMTSRGCPYRCTFCSTSSFWQNFRAFSADYVIKEINHLIEKYHMEVIHIFDDLFIADKKRFFEIVRRIKEERINEKVKFMCLARANLLDEKIMKALKEMNVVCIGIGMESGSEKILGYLKKNTVTVEQNKKTIEYGLKYKILIMGTFMVGNPDETEEDLMQTLNLIRENRFNPYLLAHAWLTAPLPGTELWEEAKRRGVVNDNMDWNDLSMDIPNTLEGLKKIPQLTDLDIKKFYEILQLFEKENYRQRFKNWKLDLSLKLIRKAIFHPNNIIKYSVEILKAKIGIFFKEKGEVGKNEGKYENSNDSPL